uniref:BUB1 N-terminal domain-containing protein n=1 Tax=Periophthalmus magnuspinnatus TaxID=409849 RepID=A0A3B4BBW1_9GOBI
IHIFSKGVGTRSTALYVCWAQQLEQRGMNDQAEAVYQKALENQAQPAEPLLHEYRILLLNIHSNTLLKKLPLNLFPKIMQL